MAKADKARVSNEKAKIYDIVATELLASYGKDGQIDKAQLLKNLKTINGVEGLPDSQDNMKFPEEALKFKVDGYDVTIDPDGTVTVGDKSGDDSGGETIPEVKTLKGITLDTQTLTVEEGQKVVLKATMVPPDADDTLVFESKDKMVAIVDESTKGIVGVDAGETSDSTKTTTITVRGKKESNVTATCTVTVTKFKNDNLTFDPYGRPYNVDKYGNVVKLKDNEDTELANGPWKLFYQDSDYTYIISDDMKENYDLQTEYEKHPEKYGDGNKVGTIGQTLNSLITEKKKSDMFTLKDSQINMKGVACLTDPEVTNWKKYADSLNGALFAIGGPTMELFWASFHAAQSKGMCGDSESVEDLEVGTYGYSNISHFSVTGFLSSDWCGGIYRKGSKENWYIASPGYHDPNYILSVADGLRFRRGNGYEKL